MKTKFSLWHALSPLGLSLMAFSPSIKATTVSGYVDSTNSKVMDAVTTLCGATAIDADQLPVPIISDVDRVFQSAKDPSQPNQIVLALGFLANRSALFSGAPAPSIGWQYLQPTGGEISSLAYSPGSPGGKWIAFNTVYAGQVAYLSQFFTIVNGVRVTRWNGRCGNMNVADWNTFNQCVQTNFIEATASVLCGNFKKLSSKKP